MAQPFSMVAWKLITYSDTPTFCTVLVQLTGFSMLLPPSVMGTCGMPLVAGGVVVAVSAGLGLLPVAASGVTACLSAGFEFDFVDAQKAVDDFYS